jgi:hypothetical protein
MTKAENLGILPKQESPQDALNAIEGGEIHIRAIKPLGESSLSDHTKVEQISDPALELAELLANHPNGAQIEESAQQTIDFYRQKSRFTPTKDTPNPTMQLAGGGEETFEMLVKRGLITPEMANEKQINLAAAIFLRLYNNPATKQLVAEDQNPQSVRIIQIKSALALQK